MHRRTLLAAAAALAAPSVRAAPARVLRFVPYVDLAILDPVANTASQTRTHAYLVWDTLYGLDEDYAPRPQMVQGHAMDNGGRQWTLTLRPGLRFHDGMPVMARDAAASIRRWARNDGFGATLMAATDALETPDDRTLRFRLNKPFPLLPDALGKISPNILPIMPERIANLPANKPIAEIIGSGPYRFLDKERVPGSRVVYERFDGYAPAEGAPGFTSGAKIAHFDRVEWIVMPEPATAAAAIRTGEVDWLEAPPPDLLPPLRRDPNLVVRTYDQTGVVPILRFNTTLPPFDNPAIRRAVLSAVQQQEFMTAFSDDAENCRPGFGCFCPGTPMATTAGLHEHVGNAGIEAASRAIKVAGYADQRVVVMGPTDHPVNSVMALVGADLFRKLGLNVDYQAMDAGTMFQRRGNREGLDRGGWSVFPSAVGGVDVLNPAVSFLTRGNGRDAWYGWPNDPVLEALRLAWYDAPDHAAQKSVCDKIQLQTFSEAPYLPLGQILQPTVHRKDLTGILPGFAKFWGVRKA
jgi:peptide/nickel transport system substrate-binding protein